MPLMGLHPISLRVFDSCRISDGELVTYWCKWKQSWAVCFLENTSYQVLAGQFEFGTRNAGHWLSTHLKGIKVTLAQYAAHQMERESCLDQAIKLYVFVMVMMVNQSVN